MAVFTPVSPEQARAHLERYRLGGFVAMRGIPAGIENTNYFLTTTGGEFVLTLFEKLGAEQLPFYMALMHQLAQRGVPVPAPQADRDGNLFAMLLGKPSAIVSRLPGAWLPHPQPEHCAQVGATLARAHEAARDLPIRQPNLRGLAWWRETAPQVMRFLAPDTAALLADEVEAQAAIQSGAAWLALPEGPVHADLFRDNALFDGNRLGGFIDFYFAGCDTWLFDLAVCVNDWCVDPATAEFDSGRLDSLLGAYAQARAFTSGERALWPSALRAAALRFWISRLYDFHLPRPAETLTPKDPTQFERILRRRRTGDIPELP